MLKKEEIIARTYLEIRTISSGTVTTLINVGLSTMTNQIAPHENSEVRLVLSGTKPLATIEKVKDPYGYALAISLASTGALHCVVQPTSDSGSGEAIITLPDNKDEVETYLYILKDGVEMYGIKSYHRRMGKLFGYSDEAIEAFIEAEIDCDCSKCTGVKP